MSKITKSIFIFLIFFLGFFAYQNASADINTLYPSTISNSWWSIDNCQTELGSSAQSFEKFFNGVSQGTGNMFSAPNACNSIQPLPLSFLQNEYSYVNVLPFEWKVVFYDSPNGAGNVLGYSQVNFNGNEWSALNTPPISEPESGVISILVNGKLPEYNTETPVTIKVIFNNLEEDNYKFIKYLIEDNNNPTKYLMGEKETSKIGLLKNESFTSNFFETNKTYTGSFFLSKFSGNSSFPGDTESVDFTITTKDIVSINGIFSSLPDYEDFECEIGLTSMTGENLMDCGKRIIAWVFLPDSGTKEKVQKMILENENTILYLPWTLLNNFTDTSDTLGEATVTLPFVGETEIVGNNFQIPYNWDNLGKILLWSIFVSMWGWFFIRKLFF